MKYSLITDLYQFTMAQSWWQSNLHNQRAIFHLHFRTAPFKNGYIIFCGLDTILNIIKDYKFDKEELNYLANLKTPNNKNLFHKDFLFFMQNFHFRCNIFSLLEGSIAFAKEPMLRVEGSLLECQLLETILLNTINFQSLIATKAARIFIAAKQKDILEFGLRRAQGIDGGLSATRAAYIGGCSATSNVLANKIYSIPVVGTHSHSWVLSFISELDAFRKFAENSFYNFSFLIDTYSILKGLENAMTVAKEQKNAINRFVAVRIDSGDIAYFSKIIRKKLDDAGFKKTKIIASNDLDEHIISSLEQQGAKVDIWAVGTKLITAKDDPAMQGIYKISALEKNKKWHYCMKISEDPEKINDPGILQIARFEKEKKFIGDVVFNDLTKNKKDKKIVMINPFNPLQKKTFHPPATFQLLLQPVMKKGKICYKSPDIHKIRSYAISQLQKLDNSTKRLINPHIYPVGLEKNLFELKQKIFLEKTQNNK